MTCAKRAGLQSLSRAKRCDIIGLERHWVQWVDYACTQGSMPVLFARARALGAHWKELIELLGLGPPSCLPSGLCRTFNMGEASGEDRVDYAKRCEPEWKRLRGLQHAMGDYRLLLANSDICESRQPSARRCC